MKDRQKIKDELARLLKVRRNITNTIISRQSIHDLNRNDEALANITGFDIATVQEIYRSEQ